MAWYALVAGQPWGPLSDAELDEAVRSGRVGPDTPVWREGMGGWAPLRTLDGGEGPPGKDVACSSCGRSVPESHTVTYSRLAICVACKPAFLARLEIGLPPARTFVFARFGTRVWARLVDGLGLFLVSTALQFPLVGFPILAPVLPDAPWFWARQAASFFIGLVVPAAYGITLHGRYGQTLGKRLLRIKVVRSDGSPLTYGRATGRHFADLLSSMTFLVGYLMAAVDDERRALHDRLCDTRVIEVR